MELLIYPVFFMFNNFQLLHPNIDKDIIIFFKLIEIPNHRKLEKFVPID